MDFVSIDNLRRGVGAFRARRNWPRDFHNSFYQQLQPLTAGSVTPEAWSQLIGFLSGWRALRPFSKERMYRAGLAHLDDLNRHLRTLDPATTLETVAWADAAPLFECAEAIKAVASPVFASKLCHFLRPAVYSVVDQAVLGIGDADYAAYWQDCQRAWRECPEPDALIAELRQAIGDEVVAHYPWGTKIVELCRIGMRQWC